MKAACGLRRILIITIAACALGGSSLIAQEASAPAQQPTYFTPEVAPWWRPKAALDVTTERIHLGDDEVPSQFTRTRSRLRLRWDFGDDDSLFHFESGVVGYLGNDGNSQNLARQDNERSNGAVLDVADLRLRWLRSAGGLELHGGLLENPLLGSESLWDADLRVVGTSGKAFFRSDGGAIQEAGWRAIVGDVRLLAHGRVTLHAAQAVLRLETGPLEWFVHAGPWRMEARQEDATNFLRSNPGPGGAIDPDGGPAYEDPVFNFMVVGAGVSLTEGLPFELKALRHDNRSNPASGDGRGQELQAWIGPRSRVWWPQVGYIRQQLGASGALASVNGDQWWFHANADGERYVLALSLPRRWRVEGSYLYQRRRDSPGPVERASVTVLRRF